MRASAETASAWVQEREWWWRTTFDAAPAIAGERVMLTFDGLDTYATIWLNGELIGESDNMIVVRRRLATAHVRIQ